MLASYNNKQRMIFSYYWMFTVFSTVGYGDFAGGTKYEYLITLLLEFAGLLVFSWISLLLSNVLARNFSYDRFISEKVDMQELWLLKLEQSSRRSLEPSNLIITRQTVLTSLQMDYNTIIEEDDFFEELSPALQQKVLLLLFR